LAGFSESFQCPKLSVWDSFALNLTALGQGRVNSGFFIPEIFRLALMKRKIVLEKGLDGYIIAYCPSCKGCVTQGKTEEEAIANLKEAVELRLEPDPR